MCQLVQTNLKIGLWLAQLQLEILWVLLMILILFWTHRVIVLVSLIYPKFLRGDVELEALLDTFDMTDKTLPGLIGMGQLNLDSIGFMLKQP